jgi:hypothetical protein
MFDLENSIADWRKQMLDAGIKTPVPLEELEIHLCEEIERQMKSGLDEQNAFEISAQTIGEARLLKIEFKKTHHKTMKTKTPYIIAAVIGGLCVAFAVWMQYVFVSLVAAVPYAAASFDSRYFWWPLCAAAVFFTLAGYGFFSHRKFVRDHAA